MDGLSYLNNINLLYNTILKNSKEPKLEVENTDFWEFFTTYIDNSILLKYNTDPIFPLSDKNSVTELINKVEFNPLKPLIDISLD